MAEGGGVRREDLDVNELLSRCGDFFDLYHGPDFQAIQGGNS